MAKLKPARAKPKKSDLRSGAPCLIFVVLIMALLMVLFYLILQSGTP